MGSFCYFYRRDSNLVKDEIKTFLNNRRISQAIVGQVTGILLLCVQCFYKVLTAYEALAWTHVKCKQYK